MTEQKRFKPGDRVEVRVAGTDQWDPAHVEYAPCEHGYVVFWEDPEWDGAFWADAADVRAVRTEEGLKKAP